MWMTHKPCVPPDCKRLGSHEDISNVGFGKDPRSGQSCIVSLSTYLRRYLYYGSDGAKTKSELTFFPHPGVVGLAQGTPEAHAEYYITSRDYYSWKPCWERTFRSGSIFGPARSKPLGAHHKEFFGCSLVTSRL